MWVLLDRWHTKLPDVLNTTTEQTDAGKTSRKDGGLWVYHRTSSLATMIDRRLIDPVGDLLWLALNGRRAHHTTHSRFHHPMLVSALLLSGPPHDLVLPIRRPHLLDGALVLLRVTTLCCHNCPPRARWRNP